MINIIGKIVLCLERNAEDLFDEDMEMIPLDPDDSCIIFKDDIEGVGININGDRILSFVHTTKPLIKVLYVTKMETFTSYEEALKALKFASDYYNLNPYVGRLYSALDEEPIEEETDTKKKKRKKSEK